MQKSANAILAALVALGLGGVAGAARPFDAERLVWNKPMKPFPVIGNVYDVGTAGLSVFLIVTPKGDILVDGALPESVPAIEKNIAALGFKLSDIKILLNTHAHFDHAGGLARLKADSGAQLYAGAGDRAILESGHIAFGPSAQVDFPPVKVDHPVHNGSKISLDGVTLTARSMPGHTPGCTSWTMTVTEAGVPHSLMFFCSMTVAGNPLVGNKTWPGIVDAYRASFAKLKGMKTDIFLAPHAEQFGLQGKLARVKPGAPNPFIDPGELQRFAAKTEADFNTELARQKAQQQKPPPSAERVGVHPQ
jgi:metallo-beta-lactamase class B